MSGWWADVSHRLAAKTLVFLALLGALYWNQERGLRDLTDQTHGALCAFKQDIEIRRESAIQYLKDNQNGVIDREGNILISSEQIQQSIDSQSATLRSLSALDCS